MTNKILFRGFREIPHGERKIFYEGTWHFGEWVEGYYCRFGHIGKEKTYIIPDYASACTPLEIAPYCIGQFSGWTDRHGKRIFRGDVITLVNEDGKRINIVCGYGKVERQIYEHKVEISGFYFLMPDGRKCFPIVHNYTGGHDTELYDVIGTVWDVETEAEVWSIPYTSI